MEAFAHEIVAQRCHHKLNFIVIQPQERLLFIFFLSFSFTSDFMNVIKFIFDIQGTPILQGISNDCHYEFDWATNIMCPMHVAEFHTNTCEIYNNQTKQTINLKTIFENGIVKVRKFVRYD